MGPLNGPQIVHQRFENNPLLVASFKPSEQNQIKSESGQLQTFTDLHSQTQT